MVTINTEIDGGAEINRDETYRDLVKTAFEQQVEARTLKEQAAALEAEAKSKIEFVMAEVEIKKIETDEGSFVSVTKGSSKFNKKGLKEWLIKKGVDSDLVTKGFEANTQKGKPSTTINYYSPKE